MFKFLKANSMRKLVIINTLQPEIKAQYLTLLEFSSPLLSCNIKSIAKTWTKFSVCTSGRFCSDTVRTKCYSYSSCFCLVTLSMSRTIYWLYIVNVISISMQCFDPVTASGRLDNTNTQVAHQTMHAGCSTKWRKKYPLCHYAVRRCYALCQ